MPLEIVLGLIVLGLIVYPFTVRFIGAPWAKKSWKVQESFYDQPRLKNFLLFPMAMSPVIGCQLTNLMEKIVSGEWGTEKPAQEEHLGLTGSFWEDEYILIASWFWPIKVACICATLLYDSLILSLVLPFVPLLLIGRWTGPSLIRFFRFVSKVDY